MSKHRREATLHQRIRLFSSQARWVVRTAWRISPVLFFGVVLTSVLVNLLPAGLAWVGKQIVDTVAGLLASGGDGRLDTVVPWLVVGFILTAAAELLHSLNAFFRQRLNENLILRLSVDILEHCASLDLEQLENVEMQNVMERVQKNPAGHFSTFLLKLIGVFAHLVQLLSLLSVLMTVEPLIPLIFLPILAPFIYSKWRHSQKTYQKEFSRSTKRRWTTYFSSTLTSRNSAPEVRILGLAPTLIERYRRMLEEFNREDRNLFISRTLMELAYTMLLGIVSYLFMARIIGHVFTHSLTIGDLTLFIAVVTHLRSSLNAVAESASTAFAELLYIADLNLFFNIAPKIRDHGGPVRPELTGNIEFRNVSFTYPGTEEEVLHDLSFSISAGETVAIVGENGAGKSTLIKLLARIYDPTTGDILIDGINIKAIALKYLHERMAIVMQSFNRYEATFFDNIAYGDISSKLTVAEVDQAAARAGIQKLVGDMPQNYQTVLGRRFGAYDLSGGLWQRIALARAFVRKRAVLQILDEPTASLDARAEYELFLKFAELAKGKTTILISHRFSTVRLAARIIVLENGRIIESGTHEELMKLSGKYAELYRLQMQQKGNLDDQE